MNWKVYLAVVVMYLLCGCSASNQNTTENYKMPPEMEGCKVFRLAGEGLNKTLYVVKCPGGSMSTNWEESDSEGNTTSYATTVQIGN